MITGKPIIEFPAIKGMKYYRTARLGKAKSIRDQLIKPELVETVVEAFHITPLSDLPYRIIEQEKLLDVSVYLYIRRLTDVSFMDVV